MKFSMPHTGRRMLTPADLSTMPGALSSRHVRRMTTAITLTTWDSTATAPAPSRIA